MPCFVPFKNNLDLTFFVLRSVSILDDEIIHSMKCFSFQAEDLGCVYSSVMKSIHGNLVIIIVHNDETFAARIFSLFNLFKTSFGTAFLLLYKAALGIIVWYGAWIKRSEENRHILNKTLLSAIEDLSHLAVLIQHGFYSVYAGESKDGQQNARFSTGDTILLCGMVPASEDSSDLSYACMAILRSSFNNVEASTAGVCLQCRDRPMVAMLHVWKSLQSCYTWLITANYRRTIRPYISNFSYEAQFDIFKVIYVSSDDVLNCEISQSKSVIGSRVGKGEVQSD
ncbi:hypothetical protein MA16_Dca006055 [Dendrobium catenatum]|uniref:DUF7392 domain-containing protein n=1 Tax=Dendrobium catenatum TaxID=906689 RepID=A0A2I0WK21_9ASPA|nr:hypothetical protein MA16_Dca006055 [Dendrobium catenatum]